MHMPPRGTIGVRFGAASPRPTYRVPTDRFWPLVLGALVALPLLLMAAGAVSAWRQAWRAAIVDLEHVADAAAEYGERVLSAHAVAAGRVDAILRGLSDDEIRARGEDLHAELRALVGELPQAEASFVIDRRGRPLLSANIHPVPSDTPVVADRDFFLALRAGDALPVHVSTVSVGRLDNALFFAVSRRRTRTGNTDVAPGEFDGLVNLSVYPNRIAEGLRRLAAREGDVLALVRNDGELLARSLGQTGPMRLPADSTFVTAAAEGVTRKVFEFASRADGVRRITVMRRLEGWPAYAQAGRARDTIIADWLKAVMAQLAIGVPATLALLGLAMVVRRDQKALAEANERLEVRVAERTAALADSEVRLRLATSGAQVGIWELDLITGRGRLSPEARQLFGTTADPTVTDWQALLHPADRVRVEAAFRRSLAADEPYEAEFRTRVPAADGTERWLAARGRAERDAAGEPARAAGVVFDVSSRRNAEERLRLLAREVDHRAKNALAVVQAAVRLAPRDDPAAFARAVEGRVAALARAQVLLSDAAWTGAELRDLAEGALAAFTPDGAAREGHPRAEIGGPALRIAAPAVQPLSLALHELATNAAKYGALSVPEGRLSLTWERDPEAGMLRLRWAEQGGPAPDGPPRRRGFGSRVIEATIRDQLGGRVTRRWEPDGLVCEMAVPLARVVTG
ncbi:HWE histidine kinase domain-containing protein [Falsiroseomonas sp. HW251]|uniref:HWE histidine kinase domain-containing protein n=1 Tax=Falsiroseomonas sp. HW251 TaxID=3390998 RepID=UPI003D3165EC